MEDSEGTSAFHASLRELLLPGNMKLATRQRQVRLTDEHGVDLGIVLTDEAHKIAKYRGLELFIVQPDVNPPLARLMDYGKYKFDLEKRESGTRKKHQIVDVKEIRLRYQIASADYRVKIASAAKILKHGDKVKLSTVLRGREVNHRDIALSLMERFARELSEVAVVDREAQLEGKSIIMMLSPAHKK